MATHLYLMRHGETLFNVQKRIQGWCDSPLTQKGIDQAKQAGRYMRKHSIKADAYFASTTERACDTLELATGVSKYGRLKGLKEMSFGSFEGQQEYLHPPRDYRRKVGNYYEIHGGESDSQVQERLKATITQLAQDYDGQTILAVSHAGALMHFAHAVGIDWESYQIFPTKCSIFEYSYDRGQFKLLRLIDPIQEIVHNFD